MLHAPPITSSQHAHGMCRCLRWSLGNVWSGLGGMSLRDPSWIGHARLRRSATHQHGQPAVRLSCRFESFKMRQDVCESAICKVTRRSIHRLGASCFYRPPRFTTGPDLPIELRCCRVNVSCSVKSGCVKGSHRLVTERNSQSTIEQRV